PTRIASASNAPIQIGRYRSELTSLSTTTRSCDIRLTRMLSISTLTMFTPATPVPVALKQIACKAQRVVGVRACTDIREDYTTGSIHNRKHTQVGCVAARRSTQLWLQPSPSR